MPKSYNCHFCFFVFCFCFRRCKKQKVLKSVLKYNFMSFLLIKFKNSIIKNSFLLLFFTNILKFKSHLKSISSYCRISCQKTLIKTIFKQPIPTFCFLIQRRRGAKRQFLNRFLRRCAVKTEISSCFFAVRRVERFSLNSTTLSSESNRCWATDSA